MAADQDQVEPTPPQHLRVRTRSASGRSGFWPATPQRLWWHHALGAPVVLALGWWAFVRGTRVPLLGWLDLAVHEFGHVWTIWLPAVGTLAMGSGTQVGLPLVIAAGLWWRSHDPLGTGLALAWAGTSAQDASVYIADAPTQALPLIGGVHDWGTLLGPAHLDAMHAAAPLARLVWLGGLLSWLAGAAVIAWHGWTGWQASRGAAEGRDGGMPATWSL